MHYISGQIYVRNIFNAQFITVLGTNLSLKNSFLILDKECSTQIIRNLLKSRLQNVELIGLQFIEIGLIMKLMCLFILIFHRKFCFEYYIFDLLYFKVIFDTSL